MKWNIALTLIIAWFAVMLVCALVGIYWVFENPEPPMRDFTLDFRDEHGNTKLDFRVTEKLYSHGTFTVTREFRRTVIRSIVHTDTGHIMAIYVPQTELLAPKKYDRTFPVTVPGDLKPGNYHVVFTQTYPLNPLQQAVPIPAPLQPFRIVQ